MRFTLLSFLPLYACLTLGVNGASASSKPSQGGSHCVSRCGYWLEDIKHQGLAAFNAKPSEFQVFRNVRDFGAKGDGVTDDTAAIQEAISSGNTCAAGSCPSTTSSQATVYFPYGTYMINSTIRQNYGVSLHGNPNCLPTIKALPNFANGPGAEGMIDGNPSTYTADVGIFFRQIRNLIIDTTLVPLDLNITGIRWPSAQATSIHNVVFNMPTEDGVQHIGLLGGGGEVFFRDLVFNGGHTGFIIPIGQHTLRNVTFNNIVVGLSLALTFTTVLHDVVFNNCSMGISTTYRTGNTVLIDSLMRGVNLGIASSLGDPRSDNGAHGIVIESLHFDNVGSLVQTFGNVTTLGGGSGIIEGWGQGKWFEGTTLSNFTGVFTPSRRPPGLLALGSDKWFSKSKPGYDRFPVNSFISARSSGARGDGRTDDTQALQDAIFVAVAKSKVLFLDHGSYVVTKTLHVPPHARIVGEAYPNIIAAGEFFKSLDFPQPVFRVGEPGQRGPVELSDFVLGTQGGTAGAIMIEHNLASDASGVGGYWDVHVRIGGWDGSELQVAQCLKSPGVPKPPVDTSCMAAYMSMHVTKSASGLYMENNWLWTADHDIDDFNTTQVQIYTGRGMLVESERGNNWLIHVPSEHHSKYQYTFSSTRNLLLVQAQTEVPYYQPNPKASLPFPYSKQLHDPKFDGPINGTNGTPRHMAWAARIENSYEITVYGASWFVYFNDWNQDCLMDGNKCTEQSFELDGKSAGITVYSFFANKVISMITRDGINFLTLSEQPGFLYNIYSAFAVFKQ